MKMLQAFSRRSVLWSVPVLCCCAPALAAARAPAIVGPPAICFPIDIGDARSLPFGKDAFAAERGYGLERVVPDTLAILEASDDALVHMETVRRAAVYLARSGAAGDEQARDARCHALLSKLRRRVLALEFAEPGVAPRRVKALATFDLGYALAALGQLGWREDASGEQEVERALELAPDDGALQLGAALAFWDTREDATWKHLAAAYERASDPRGALRANLLGTAGRILDVSTHEQLGERIRRRRT